MCPLSSSHVLSSRENLSICVKKCLIVQNPLTRLELYLEDSRMKLCDWIEFQRLRKGWSKAELSREADVSRQIVYDIINGARVYSPGDTILARLERAFGERFDPAASTLDGAKISGWLTTDPALLGRAVAALIQLDGVAAKKFVEAVEDEVSTSHNGGTAEGHQASPGRRSRRGA